MRENSCGCYVSFAQNCFIDFHRSLQVYLGLREAEMFSNDFIGVVIFMQLQPS
ncbi:MAG: hypothetical protein IPP19_13135 [Verrucomicrobia bacterium]|nr:hypothetical protein [Verrucomicrobiota bacterium]